jgi:hypothetical protein
MSATPGNAPTMAMPQSSDGTGTKTHTNTNPTAKIPSETSSLFKIALASDCMSVMMWLLSGYCRRQGRALLSSLAHRASWRNQPIALKTPPVVDECSRGFSPTTEAVQLEQQSPDEDNLEHDQHHFQQNRCPATPGMVASIGQVVAGLLVQSKVFANKSTEYRNRL